MLARRCLLAFCKTCGADTQLFDCGVPICIPCIQEMDRKAKEKLTRARGETSRAQSTAEHDTANSQHIDMLQSSGELEP